MLYLGVLKRVLPFLLTFAAGLFIASFFINISAPSFNFKRSSKKCRESRQLRYENERIKRENADLRRQLEQAAGMKTDWTINAGPGHFEADVPPPPPPPAPRRHRVLIDK